MVLSIKTSEKERSAGQTSKRGAFESSSGLGGGELRGVEVIFPRLSDACNRVVFKGLVDVLPRPTERHI